MSIKKMFLVAAGAAVLTFGVSVSAQDAEDAVLTEETAVEEEEAAAAVAAPQPAPVVAQAAAPAPAPVPAPEPAKAEPPKPGIEIKPYGAAQYRFRGRLWSATGPDAAGEKVSGSSFDYLNLYGWQVGLNVKFDAQLSLQIQIGNDWGANEPVTWNRNNTTGGGYASGGASRVEFNNLYVHLANATWNPGYIYLSAGVVGLSTSGALDLLERSLSTGSYNEAIYQTWAATANSSVIGTKLGLPIAKEDVKVAAELTASIIDQRSQTLVTGDAVVTEEPKSNPTSVLLSLNLPIAAGDFKITPEFVSVINRNYNSATEKGDHEILFGGLASYKASPVLSFSASGAYGQVSNKNSKIGRYGNTHRGAGSTAAPDEHAQYESKGWFAGIGGSLKAGPGTFALDFKYQNSLNDENDDTKKLTNVSNFHIDPRYTIVIHPKFTIAPRWRFYLNTYDDKPSGRIESKIENRPELILTGTF